MSRLLIVEPLPIAAVTASRGSGAANLATKDPREVWADSASGSAATLTIDFGSARPIDTILLGHVRTPSADATWAISGGLATPTENVIAPASTLRVPDVAGAFALTSHALWTGPAVSVRYLRITIVQPAGESPLTIGAFVAGLAFSPALGKEWGSGRRAIDTGSVTPLPDGGYAIVEGVRKRSFTWTFGDLTDEEADRLELIALRLGETSPGLVVEDPDRTAGLHSRILYGVFERWRPFERRNVAQTQWEIAIEDWGAASDVRQSATAPAPPSPTVTLSADIAKAEGNSGDNVYLYTVTLSAPAAAAVAVPWSFAPGNTTAADFKGGTLPAGGTVAIAAGATTGTFVITVNGDSDVEPDETFTVSIAAPAGYVAGPRMSATGTIQNDDTAPTPTVTLSEPQAVTEGNSGATIITYTVTRSTSAGATAVVWSFSPGNTSASDFSGGSYPAGGSLAFAAGQTSRTFDISVAGDTDVETDETFTVSIAAPSGYAAGARMSATGTILNDDTAPMVPISSVNADGWSAEWANPATLPAYSTGDTEFAPDTAPILIPLLRKGYDETGALRTDINESVVVTRRVRRPWTNGTTDHLTGAPSRVALSGYIFSTDTVIGVANNNSTETSARPTALQLDRNRRVVGDTAYCQARGYHWSAKNGKPLAAMRVWFRSVDGTKQTTPMLMSGPKVLPGGNDRFAVIGYDATVLTTQWSDGTPIADGTTIIREMEALPRIGDAASIRTTVGQTVDARGFTPQSFYKHTGRATAPLYVYVNQSTGVDETVSTAGVGSTSGAQKVSTSATTAKANSFATITSAIQALKAATTLTGGFTDGCFVHLAPGTYTSPANTLAGTYQSGGELIIEPDPAAPDYSAIITGTFTSFRQSYLTYRRMAFVRSSTSQLIALTGGRLALVNCTIDQGSQTTVFWNTAPIYVDGLTVTGTAPLAGAQPCHLMRGVQAGVSKGASTSIDAYNLSGSSLFNPVWSFVARPSTNSIQDSFAAMGCMQPIGPGFIAGENVDGYATVNYIVEYANTATSNPIIRVSGDGETSNVRGLIDWCRTGGGASLYGRDNDGYDETLGTLRSHTQWSRRGRSMVASYTKHDWFLGANAPAGSSGDARRAEAPSHVGAWSVMYEVNSLGNFHQFPTAAGTGPNFGPNGNENPAFFGLKARYPVNPASPYVRLDPKYVGGTKKAADFDGVTATGGTGGVAADYAPAADSPLIGILAAADEAIAFDITGAPRTRGTLGAYA